MEIFWDYKLEGVEGSAIDAAIYFDNKVIGGPRTGHKFNVAVVCCEPFEIIGHDVEKYLLMNWAEFDLILTDKESLLSLPNSVLFIFAHPWMRNEKGLLPSKFGVSSVIGHKMWTLGHRLRHVLWDRRHEIVNIPVYLYASHHGGPPSSLILGEKR
ncbi:hypothetical protein ACRBEV_22635 [Methylobacterium phyllosphaerae]